MNWTILKLLEWADEYLKKQGIKSSRTEAEILLAFVLGKKRIDLYIEFERNLSQDILTQFKTLIQRRIKKEPIQYILEKQEFWSMDFKVGPGVLIPRSETECLIEEVLKIWKKQKEVSILDIGTGSGILAIVLAKEITCAKIHAIDISKKALEYARFNAARHGVAERITFYEGDLFPKLPQMIDVIVSNPPYIAEMSWETLEEQVKNFEPKEALVGGKDGIDFHLKILKEAPLYLNSKAVVALEIAPQQAFLLKDYLIQEKTFSHIEIVKDYENKERILIAHR